MVGHEVLAGLRRAWPAPDGLGGVILAVQDFLVFGCSVLHA
jgi:hypothetical protein